MDDFVLARTVCSEQPGDVDGDSYVSLLDYGALPACMTGPAGGVSVECAILNVNLDGKIDLEDFAEIQVAFNPPP